MTGNRTRAGSQKNSNHKSVLEPPKKGPGGARAGAGRPRVRALPYEFNFYKPTRPIPHYRAKPENIERAKRLAVEAMRIHGVVVEACRASGIGRHIVYEWMHADPEWKREMYLARRDRIEEVERSMFERGSLPRGDLMSIFTLKHNKRAYREISRIELTGKDGAPVAFAEMKDEMLRRLEKLSAALATDAQLVRRGSGSAGSDGARGLEGLRPQLVKGDEITVKKIAGTRTVANSKC